MTSRRGVACWISKATRKHLSADTRQSAWAPVRTHARVHTHRHKYIILLFHGNNGFVNTRQYYVIRTLPVLLKYDPQHTFLGAWGSVVVKALHY